MTRFMLSLAVFAGLAFAAGAEEKKMMKKSEDEKFAMGATSGGLFEIESSKLALAKSSDPEVKKYAQQMIDDHTKAGEQLKVLLKSKGMTVPEKLNPVHAAMVSMLSECPKGDFDDAYKAKQFLAHEEAVLCAECEVKKGSDPDIKGFAAKVLPTFQMHLSMARKMVGKPEMMMQAAPASGVIVR